MTHPLSKPTHVHLHIITWQCRDHGPHRLVMASLDGTADEAALALVDCPTIGGERPAHRRIRLPLEVARMIAEMDGLNLDDLPY